MRDWPWSGLINQTVKHLQSIENLQISYSRTGSNYLTLAPLMYAQKHWGGSKEKTTAKIPRLALRATIQQQLLIRRAAEIAQKSVTEFVLDSACAAAQNTLTDQKLFFVDEADFDEFQKKLEEPAVIKPNLRKLLNRKSQWE